MVHSQPPPAPPPSDAKSITDHVKGKNKERKEDAKLLAVTPQGRRANRGQMVIILFPSDFSTFSKSSLMSTYCCYNERDN